MKKRAIVTVFTTTCLLIGLAISNVAQADLSAQKNSQGHNLKEGMNCLPVMWEDPVDLESRDLFYGIGGRKGAPDPTGRFIFIKRDTEGHARKIQVEDEKGRKWRVKFGSEPRPETAATRIVWAVGYHADQSYFVRQARIDGYGDADVSEVRFERDNDGYKKVGRWD